MDDPIVTAAVIGGIVTMTGTLVSAWISVRTHRNVRTNHGMRAGEYLEMIPHVITEQVRVREELQEYKEQTNKRFDTVEVHQLSHDAQDAINFADVGEQLRDLRTKVGDIPAALVAEETENAE